MLSDVRYALKWLLRSPGFAAVAVLSLGVGIGFNTAHFSIVDALLFRPLPVSQPDRLVDVYTRGEDGDTYSTSSYPDFLDFSARNTVFGGMMMRRGLSLAAAGIATGGLLAWIGARAIASALYGVGAADPLAWTAAIGVLLGSAALANYLPASRAARVDPSIALRAS